jgi:osmotically-inducible protein OsmY
MMETKDRKIWKDIIDQLYWDDRVEATHISVEVEGGKAILRGSVPTVTARRQAQRDALAVQGVTSVDNQLTVEYPPAVPGASDEQLKSYVENVIGWSSDMDRTDIEVSVNNGWVTLSGTVDAFWKKRKADELAALVNGILGIQNNLAVVPTRSYSDKTIAASIISALERNVSIDVTDVDVSVENGTVTLSGSVQNGNALVGAYKTAQYTAGVKDVVSNLSIEGGESREPRAI